MALLGEKALTLPMEAESTGQKGEEIAVRYLKNKGYKILDRNFFFKSEGGPKIAEIDIIAREKNCFVFAEVKTLRVRQGSRFRPEDKVNGQKLWKLSKAAELWLIKNRYPLNLKWRIDVIAVQIFNDSRPKIIRWLFGQKLKISHFRNVATR